jgi:hypothetical protein
MHTGIEHGTDGDGIACALIAPPPPLIVPEKHRVILCRCHDAELAHLFERAFGRKKNMHDRPA